MKTIVLPARIMFIFLVALFVFRFVVQAQQTPPPDLPLDAATRTAVIENLIKELNDGYIFVETAKKMGSDLRTRLTNKEYDMITGSRAFADKLTTDLQAISHDKHLRIRFYFDPIPIRSDKNKPTVDEQARFDSRNRRANFGFDQTDRLDGNIGYIKLWGFMDPAAGSSTVSAAMTMVANTDALIIDLRQNGGGDPAMVALICSYFFGNEKVHLNDLYYRAANNTEEYWTDPAIPGKKYNKDIYVLTSSRTFSGAEEFSYDLKNLKRATIVGEVTGGGANPGDTFRLTEHFLVFVPTGRAINPITKTNWEGTGVEPDVKVPKELALKVAYLMALKKSLEIQKNLDFKVQLQEVIDQAQKDLDAIKAKN